MNDQKIVIIRIIRWRVTGDEWWLKEDWYKITDEIVAEMEIYYCHMRKTITSWRVKVARCRMTWTCYPMSNDVWMLSDVQWRVNVVRCRLTYECSPLSNDVWMLPNVEWDWCVNVVRCRMTCGITCECCLMSNDVWMLSDVDKGNNKITELQTILERESQNS